MTFRIHDGDLDKAGAGRLQKRLPPVRRGRKRRPIHKPGQRQRSPFRLQRDGKLPGLPFRGRNLDVGVRRREGDVQRLFVAGSA